MIPPRLSLRNALFVVGLLLPAGAPLVAQESLPPLNRYAGERVVVLPVQSVAVNAGVAGATAGAPTQQVVDSALTATLEDRGLTPWIFPPALVRSARRNPTYVTDPYRIRATSYVRRALSANDAMILEPLASQLRGIIAVSDARYVLVPMAWVAEVDSAGGKASLELALIDARASQVRWSGTVRTDHQRDSLTGLLRMTLKRAADLFVPSPD